MTPLDALAAAIRERLVSGRPAPLPGLGTLVRQHVSARIEERPNGTRLLLPPGETIGLAELADEHESLATAFGRFRALSEAEAPQAFENAMDQMEARLAATGEVRLPGVGLLRRTSGGVVLGVEADLLAAVNRTFEGLPPVETGRTGAAPAAPPPEPADTELAEETIPESPPSPATPPVLPEDEPEDIETDLSTPSEEGSPFDAGRTVALDEFADGPFDADTAAQDDDLDLTLPDEEWNLDAPTQTPDEPTAPPTLNADEETTTPDRMPGVTQRPAPTPEPVEAAESPTDGTFVDDDTLDDDLDDVLAVPFGTPSDETLADLLPPTPPEADMGDSEPVPDTSPADADAASPETLEPPAEETAEDAWIADTWTATAADPPPPSFGDEEPLIEDAEIVEDDPGLEDADLEDADVVVPPASETLNPSVPIDRVGPEAEFDALFTSPSAATFDEPPTGSERIITPAPESAPAAVVEDEARRGFPWWIPAFIVMALVLAALLLWPRFQGQSPADETPTTAFIEPDADGAPAPLDDDAPPNGAPDAPGASAPTGEASPGATTRPESGDAPQTAPSNRPDLGRAPAADDAILPPRLAGLDAEDVRALSGDPVDPDAEAWTFVVLSTRSREDAQALSARYGTAGYRTAVLDAPGSTRRHRVAVGQFASREQALRLRDRLPPQAPPDTWLLDLRTL